MVIVERIYQVLDKNGDALYISNVLGRVWHAGLLHMLKGYGISG